MLQYVGLKYGHEPLQIYISDEFAGERSGYENEIYLEKSPIALTQDEIDHCQKYVKSLNYKQSLVLGAVLVDGDDALLQLSQDTLDEIELKQSLQNSRKVGNGGQRSAYERVLIIRESGYKLNGSPELVGAA
jgi:hypothetical protein